MKNSSAIKYMLAGSLALFMASSVLAGTPCFGSNYINLPKSYICTAAPITSAGSGSASRRDKQVFAGINWKFGSTKAPEFVLGFQSVKVQSDKDVSGGRLELTALLKDGLKPNTIKLSAVEGKTGAQGLLGAGYAFGQGFLLNGGLQIPYVTGGVDYVLGSGLTPYVGINTLHKQAAPNSTAGVTTCPAVTGSGFSYNGPTLVGSNCQIEFTGYIPN